MISLAIPPLAAGEQPPATCPHCGAISLSSSRARWVQYACEARYGRRLSDAGVPPPPPTPEWCPQVACPSPRPSAVLRAVRAGLTPEQRERVILHEGRGVGDVRLTAGDALELLIEESPRA